MYVHFFDDYLERNTVQSVIDILEEKKEKGVRLYIATNGGSTDAAKCLIDYINLNKKDIKVVLTGIVMSAGTFFLTHLEEPAEISEELEFLMFHRIDHEEYTKRKVNNWYSSEKRKQATEVYNEDLVKKYRKLGLTKEELDTFMDGGEVYIYRQDFDRLNITAAE